MQLGFCPAREPGEVSCKLKMDSEQMGGHEELALDRLRNPNLCSAIEKGESKVGLGQAVVAALPFPFQREGKLLSLHGQGLVAMCGSFTASA